MKQEVLLLNVCRYKDKTTDKPKTSFQYVLVGSKTIADNKNYKGCSVLTMFLDNDNLDLLSPYILDTIEIEMEFISNTNNPLRPKTKIKGIKDKNGKYINLV